MKERVSKKYRHPDLDKKLNKQRLHQEARCMAKCLKAGIACPGIYLVNSNSFRIYMEHVVGVTVKQLMWSVVKSVKVKDALNAVSFTSPVLVWLAKSIGQIIGKLHCVRMVHGDLTTSNIMVRRKVNSGWEPSSTSACPDITSPDDSILFENFGQDVVDSVLQEYSNSQDEVQNTSGFEYEVVLVDFGLGKMMASVEDMAVDLYVLERAFTSTHPGCEGFLANILHGYENCVTEKVESKTDTEAAANVSGTKVNPNQRGDAKLIKEVVEKLETVRMRGRKRDMIG